MKIPAGILHAKGLFRFGAMLVILAALGATPCGATADESLEHSVEAAFLYKFGHFVEWPESAFASPASPFNLCIVGDDPFGPTLDKVVEGELIDGHSIVIHRLKKMEKDSGCHILYLGNSDAQSAARIIADVRGNNILTVSSTDESGSDESGSSAGIIDFVIANNHVRFNIDDEAAAQNKLVISSKLLDVALNVKQRKAKEKP
jgi:hypothetical protein